MLSLLKLPHPAQLDGSFLGLVYKICNSNLGNVLGLRAH